MITKEAVINNQVGLHARPATFFIQKANEFKSSIWIEKDERRVNAKSLLGVLSLGIVKGTTETTFSPYDVCSRAQIVTFLWRSVKSPDASGTNTFEDVQSGAYYSVAVLWALDEGITKGYTATQFVPNGFCNRAQIATFIFRSMK